MCLKVLLRRKRCFEITNQCLATEKVGLLNDSGSQCTREQCLQVLKAPLFIYLCFINRRQAYFINNIEQNASALKSSMPGIWQA